MDKLPTNQNWAEEVELETPAISLPPPSEVYKKNLKIVTEYHHNEEGKTVKTVRTFRIEKKLVSKSVALRKTWKKFGDAANDKPGPNSANTIVSEKIEMQFICAGEESNKIEDDDGLKNLKDLGSKNIVKCRTCGGDHWTSKCPLKDTSLGSGKPLEKQETSVTTKYVPPSMRAGANRAEGPSNSTDDLPQIKITNLSEFTQEQDLHELVRSFGPVQKIFLPVDKVRNVSKGYAFVTFKFHEDAVKALDKLNKYRYDHLVLDAEWAKRKER